MFRSSYLAPACAGIVLSLLACGDDVAATDGGIDAAPCTTARAERYLPLEVGATWNFRITPTAGPAETKANTVIALEDVGDRKAGTTAFRVRTEKLDGATVSWQEDRCTSITRHREQSLDLQGNLLTDQFYLPDKIRIDEAPARLTMGATWTVAYTEVEVDTTGAMTTRAKDETWSVQAIAESVTVPAGTFTALKLNKTTSGSADKTYWFVKGVGKVKETGDQTEELVSFTLP
jgi:hypothetical protein